MNPPGSMLGSTKDVPRWVATCEEDFMVLLVKVCFSYDSLHLLYLLEEQFQTQTE